MTTGDRYGAYCLAGELDSGGMATVHVATHTRLGHVVAVKILHPHYQKDDFLRSRFVDEARIQANLVHRNVLSVRDILELPGTTAIVMDLLRGVSLKQYFKRAGLPLSTRRVLELFIAITDGLDAAHTSGIVHRDLKPSNIFLHSDGGRVIPKIMDFGVAKHQWLELKEQNTATGTVLGTPHYMAPEQYDDASTVDRQADIFSLGVMLFEATTGRVPFDGRRPASMMASVLTRPVPKPSGIQMDYPLQLEEVILRCLEKDPMDRYRNAAALREALLEVAEAEGREEIPCDEVQVPNLEALGILLDRSLGGPGASSAKAEGAEGDPFWDGTLARPGREDDSQARVGSLLSGFQIQEILQDSGTTAIYRGIGVDDGRPVLLKGHRKEIPNVDEIARMRHEYQLLKDLDIEGAPRARNLLKHQNGYLLVLDDEGGLPLSRLLEDGPLDLRDALAYGLRLAAVVTRLHAREVIHKQITPDNVFVNPGTGVVELVDFGLASRQPAHVVSPGAAAAMQEDLRYVSPEQTGRINRVLDYRTDFYSLGATLYCALTGAPPFESENPEELIRMVVGKRPNPAWATEVDVPAVVSDIIDRLLSKDPEARYQSGRGLQADLERCLRQVLTGGGVQPFQLGTQDVSERFTIPQRLYGRDVEVRALVDAFARTRSGPVELFLVAGVAGIGKTALVGELHGPVTEARGVFVEGKFDQYTRDVPYGAIIEGFHRVMRDLVTRSEGEQEEWRARIVDALGPNLAVIGDVAPGLYDLVGPQPPAPELPPAEARNRFLLAVHNLVGVFARPDHPMVLFLDDLQWADAASLRLLIHMLAARERRHLLLIGAYRDNEVDPAHRLRAALEEIESLGHEPGQVTLGGLALSAVNQLVAEAVDRTIQEVEPLGAVLGEISGGNPFFLGVCLRSFQTEGWISFQMRTGRWSWDLDEIQRRTGDLRELLARKVGGLSGDARLCLRAAACVGNQFDLLTLSLALERRPAEVLSLLKESVGEQLILGLGETYKYFDLDDQGEEEEVPERLFYGAVVFKFAHDRIQQAAYRLIPEAERAAFHWAIGQHMLRALPEAERRVRIFGLVNQLNAGRVLAVDLETRLSLAEFNLIAARRAKASTAYRSSFNYLLVALELCGEEAWRSHHSLALDIHVEAAEAAYLSTEFEDMERYVDRVVEHAESLDEKIRAYQVQMQGDIARARKREAIRTGLRVLGLLGVRIPEAPTLLDVGLALAANRVARGRRSIEALAELPEMTDPRVLTVMQVAAHVNSTAYVVNPNLFGLLVLKQAEFSARYGNTVTSAYAYALQGTIIGGILGKWREGYRYGRMALALLERTGQRAYAPETIFTAAGTTQHFREHLTATFEPLLDAYRLSLENGNFEFVGVNAGVYIYYRFHSGGPLREVANEAANYAEVLGQVKQDAYYHYTRQYQQTMLNLRGEAKDPLRVQGRAFDEAVQGPRFVENADGHGIANLVVLRMMLHYLLGDAQDALAASREAREFLLTIAGMIQLPVFHFYHALAALACKGRGQALDRQDRKLLREDLKKLEEWSGYAPQNIAHKWLLVRAELHRVAGRDRKALADYDQAIELAGEHGYTQEQALANELAARHYLAAGREKLARTYLGDAWVLYRLWGAAAKLRRLEVEFPALTRGMDRHDMGPDTTRGTRRTTRSRQVRGGPDDPTQVDARALLDRVQDLRKELQWGRLLERILVVGIEQTGARRGVLVLQQKEHLVVEAEVPAAGEGDGFGLRSLLRDREDLARAVVAWVVEHRLPVALGDAPNQGSFVRDAYIYTRRPRSILCVPLLLDSRVYGALYLEHQEEAEVFDARRIELAQVLADESTVALDNAMKYKLLAEEKRDLELQLKALTEDQRTMAEKTED